MREEDDKIIIVYDDKHNVATKLRIYEIHEGNVWVKMNRKFSKIQLKIHQQNIKMSINC